MSIGWIVVSFFTMFVGLGMAEITSAIPTRFVIQSCCSPYFDPSTIVYSLQWRTILLGCDSRAPAAFCVCCVDHRMGEVPPWFYISQVAEVLHY